MKKKLTEKEKAEKLYKDKLFYEAVRFSHEDFTRLYGPLDNIYYTSRIGKKPKGAPNYKFVQVVDGRPVQAFTENEILVVKKPIGKIKENENVT